MEFKLYFCIPLFIVFFFSFMCFFASTFLSSFIIVIIWLIVVVDIIIIVVIINAHCCWDLRCRLDVVSLLVFLFYFEVHKC